MFLALLAEALWIERTLAFDVLPKLEREADSEFLAQAFAEHLAQTREHPARVEEVFLSLDAEPVAAASAALHGLRAHHDRQIEQIVAPRLKDMFLIDLAARTEQLEIVLYTTLLEIASTIPVEAASLAENHDEEEGAVRRLEQVRRELRDRIASKSAWQ